MKWVCGEIADTIRSVCRRFAILRAKRSDGTVVFIAFRLTPNPGHSEKRQVIGGFDTADEARAACQEVA